MATQSLGKYSCDCGNEVEPVINTATYSLSYNWTRKPQKCCKATLDRIRALMM